VPAGHYHPGAGIPVPGTLVSVSPSVIVIGAGVVGASIAYELAASGNRVQVIDARRPGQGATRASAGVLAPYIEGHEATPLRELGRRSLHLYDGFIDRVRADSTLPIVYQRNGTIEVALTSEEVDRLSAASAAFWKQGIEARWVPPLAFEDHEPLLSSSALGALLIPEQGFVGVSSLTNALIAGAEHHGARIKLETGAIHIHPMPAGRVGVETSDASWDADRAVLAAGSWSSQISVEGAEPVPVRPIRGQIVQLQTDPGALRHVIWHAAGYLVPWPDGTVLVGATVEDVAFDEGTTEEAIRNLREMAAALVPSLADAPMTDARAGLRPRGTDDLPLVGPSATLPGLIYATAHYRNGVLLAPLTAELVKQLVLDRPADSSLQALSPARVGL
jgi:glycine oxidase